MGFWGSIGGVLRLLEVKRVLLGDYRGLVGGLWGLLGVYVVSIRVYLGFIAKFKMETHMKWLYLNFNTFTYVHIIIFGVAHIKRV